MIRRLAALLALATGLGLSTPAGACPEPNANLLFHSCWAGRAHARLLLLPEELPLPGAGGLPDGLRVTVTGAYTGTERRAGGAPNPVGLFVNEGHVVNRNLGRMDGVLIIDPADGEPRLHHREHVRMGEHAYNLTELAQRRAFLGRAADLGLSVMQSHLLVVDGRVDVRPQEGAPVFLRRMLFTDALGFGLYQTRWPVTLHDAAQDIVSALAPDMVLNLDMGSFDFCRRVEAGLEASCGSLRLEDIGKLSNLLVLSGG